jgi:hypothetical protein
MKIINFLIKKVGWGGITFIFLGVVIYSYVLIKKRNRIANSDYVKGISLGVDKGVHGSLYLYYSFVIDNEVYKGNVTTNFCDECPKCCVAGDTVIVRYENGNPENNDLVVKVPKDEKLQ